MARFREGERVRLSGEIPGLGRNVEGQLGTVYTHDEGGLEVHVDGDRPWRFDHWQVEPVGGSGSPISVLGKAAQEVLEHHVSVESGDNESVPQCYMSVGDLRSLVRRAKEEGVL